MIIPIQPVELFELNRNYKIQSFDNNILVVDDWYENFYHVHEILNNTSVPVWKKSPQSRNFKDYFDCRLVISNHFFPETKFNFFIELTNLLKNFFDNRNYSLFSNLLEFNFFKHLKKDVSNNFQFYPHVDKSSKPLAMYNCLVFIDEISSGGTAFYPSINFLENREGDNVLFDVGKLEKTVIKARPNRLIIFNGNHYHGGYIEDHNRYLNSWRINQVTFLT